MLPESFTDYYWVTDADNGYNHCCVSHTQISAVKRNEGKFFICLSSLSSGSFCSVSLFVWGSNYATLNVCKLHRYLKGWHNSSQRKRNVNKKVCLCTYPLINVKTTSWISSALNWNFIVGTSFLDQYWYTVFLCLSILKAGKSRLKSLYKFFLKYLGSTRFDVTRKWKFSGLL